MLFILLGVLFLALIVLCIYKAVRSCDPFESGVGVVFFGICLVIVAIVPICINVSQQSKIAELQAFRSNNYDNYSVTVDRTGELMADIRESSAEALLNGSIELMGQGSSVSSRLAEWRNAINGYNSDIKRMKRMHSNFWVGIAYPVPPEELGLITIQ